MLIPNLKKIKSANITLYIVMFDMIVARSHTLHCKLLFENHLTDEKCRWQIVACTPIYRFKK